MIYYVYNHDKWSKPSKVKPLEEGYHITRNPEGFRNLPIESINWCHKVEANSKIHALSLAKSKQHEIDNK